MKAARFVYVVECRPARVKPHVWTPLSAWTRLADALCEREEADWAERDGEDSARKETIYRIVKYFPNK